MTTDPILKVAQEREHELAIQLGQSLVRIDALKFELAEATARIAALEAERDAANQRCKELGCTMEREFIKFEKRVAELEAERDALGATCPTCLAMAAHVGCPTAAEAWDVIMRSNMENHDIIQEQFNKVKEQARRIEALEASLAARCSCEVCSTTSTVCTADQSDAHLTVHGKCEQRIAALEAELTQWTQGSLEAVIAANQRIAALEAERDIAQGQCLKLADDIHEQEVTLERDLAAAHKRIAALEAERDALQVQVERWRQSYGRQTP